jgi:hypothetical protein
MVLLTVTSGIAQAIAQTAAHAPDELQALQRPDEPTLADAQPGNPISHGQLIALAKLLKRVPASPRSTPQEHSDTTAAIEMPTLAALLRNTTIYIPPPPPKKAQTPEYRALMARLRAQEEAAAYERMLNPPPARETFSQRFPNSRTQFSNGIDEEDDVSFEEVHRQIILIINVLVSIVCVAVFIWVAARHWSVGKRLGLSMGGSVAVAIAEVAVYSGYVRKVKEAKRLEKKKPEIKKIVQSWILDGAGERETSLSTGAKEAADDGVRYRKGKHR